MIRATLCVLFLVLAVRVCADGAPATNAAPVTLKGRLMFKPTMPTK